MGYWQTNSGKVYKVNLGQDHIKAMKDEGARFCWFADNPGINDENNEIFYETKTVKNEHGNDQTRRALREGITVTAENGQQMTGYVSHWVENKDFRTDGTDHQGWFIFQPKTYPTEYIIKPNPEEDVVVTDL